MICILSVPSSATVSEVSQFFTLVAPEIAYEPLQAPAKAALPTAAVRPSLGPAGSEREDGHACHDLP